MAEQRYITNEYPDFSVGIKDFNESAFMERLEQEHDKGIGKYNFSIIHIGW